jgi:hypothetical protein
MVMACARHHACRHGGGHAIGASGPFPAPCPIRNPAQRIMSPGRNGHPARPVIAAARHDETDGNSLFSHRISPRFTFEAYSARPSLPLYSVFVAPHTWGGTHDPV